MASRGAAPGAAPRANPVPYDYGASFELKGIPGRTVQGVITISPDSFFVATAIGYGFEEERGRPLEIAPLTDQSSFLPADLTLRLIPANALIDGFRVHSEFEPMVFLPREPADVTGRAVLLEREFADQPVAAGFASRILQRVKPRQEISFLFSIVDTSTGRELQDEPTFNVASLGKSNGERPFRPLSQPVPFLPHSTIRIQVVERSEDVQGTLFIVLYGYRFPGLTSCPEPVVRGLGPVRAGLPGAPPGSRVVPFDYVAKLPLIGQAGNEVVDDVVVNVEGGFVATSIGYGLAVQDRNVTLRKDLGIPPPAQTTLDLGDIPLRLFPSSALTDGVRIRPSYLRIAFQNNGVLASALPVALLDNLFERLNRPEDVSFRYFLEDTGAGEELQNIDLHNVAGLGIADGDRPFKKFARPLVLEPRSKIRVAVREQFGRGLLFVVLHGYRITSAAGGRP